MYTPKDFSHLLGTAGFSDEALTTHFKLYEGYVKNTNLLSEKLKALAKDDQPTPEYAELKRRFGWEWNGMRLHEYHFGGMIKGGKKLEESATLAKAINVEFGSFENWKKDFIATASLRGIGWTVIYLDHKEHKLINTWINEHDAAHLAGATPLLNIDMFEHAFMIDYKTNKAEYITAFMNAINWEEIAKRFDEAVA